MKISQTSSLRHGFVLAGFALLVTVALSLTQRVTQNRIKANQAQQRQQVLAEVLPAKLHDHPLQQFSTRVLDERTNSYRTCYVAKLNNVAVAVIITATATDGYAGDIDLLVGITKDGNITGVRVSRHQETPGLGDAIESTRSDWIKNFDGKSLLNPTESRWALRKNNGDFDQFTGATITPRAVVKEVKNTLEFFQSVKSQWFKHE